MTKEFFKWALIGILTILTFTALTWMLMPASKYVERQVQVNSHQYIEGMEQRARVLEANIAEIDAMLMTNPENAEQLRAQRRTLNARLQATLK